jgi:endonuclease VIII
MPEGDTLHRWASSLHAALAGKALVHAASTRAELACLIGHRVVSARAQGKHLLIELDEGHVLRTHLRMHGTIRVRDGSYAEPLMNPHVRWLLSTADKTALCLDAPTVELLHRGELGSHPVLSRLGPDVLGEGLDVSVVIARLRERPETAIGSALLDQELLSGIGNIYKSETLFLAEVSPFSLVRELDDTRLTRIIELARELMRKNLGARRRTTPEGRIASRYWVYERSGEPCLRCGARVAMQRQEPLARSTYYCAECQQLPPAHPKA